MAKVSEQLDLLLEEMTTWDRPEYIISNLTHLVDIHPELLTHSFTYEVLGRAYGLQDNKPLAAEIFEMALKLDPTRQAGQRLVQPGAPVRGCQLRRGARTHL